MTFHYFFFVICKQGKEDLEKKLLLQHYMDRKKQSLEVFYKKSYFNSYFNNINRKRPVLESLFNTVSGIYPNDSFTKWIQHMRFHVNIEEHLSTAVSEWTWGAADIK